MLTLRSSPQGFLMGPVLLIFLVFCVVLLCVFTFFVPHCDVYYDFHIQTMICSILPPVVCRSSHLLLCSCVCLRIAMSKILFYHISLRSEFRVVMSLTIFAQSQCSVRLYLQLFVGGL